MAKKVTNDASKLDFHVTLLKRVSRKDILLITRYQPMHSKVSDRKSTSLTNNSQFLLILRTAETTVYCWVHSLTMPKLLTKDSVSFNSPDDIFRFSKLDHQDIFFEIQFWKVDEILVSPHHWFSKGRIVLMMMNTTVFLHLIYSIFFVYYNLFSSRNDVTWSKTAATRSYRCCQESR